MFRPWTDIIVLTTIKERLLKVIEGVKVGGMLLIACTVAVVNMAAMLV